MYNVEVLRPIANELPEPVKANALELLDQMGTVIEGIGERDIVWRPQFLKLVQGTTNRSSLPKGTAIGAMLLGEEVVEAPFEFIPLRLGVARQYWDPDQTNTRMLCQSPDAKMGFIGQECKTCPKAEWVEGEGSECSKIYNLLAISADLKTVFSVNFAKSGYKVGAEFEQTLRKAGVSPYMRTYSLESETSSKNKNVELFKIGVLGQDKRRTDEAKLPFLKALFDQITDNRKIMLTDFYKMANERAAREKQLALSNGGADSTLVIEDDSAGDTAAAPAADSGSTTKGYSI